MYEIDMDPIRLAHLIGSIIGIFLLALTYTFMDKLEKIGCACAEHQYRKFVKIYPIVAIVFLLITMFVQPEALGKSMLPVFALLKFAYIITTIVFFVLALIYVRYLKTAKCQCSEDIRREVLYIWSILEIILMVSLVVFYMLEAVLSSGSALAMATFKGVNRSYNTVREAAVNPISAVRKLPASLRKNARTIRKAF
jgi:amino acid transporter